MALVLHHRDSHADVAHGGPPFIIWHRIYLSMFEEALRQISPDVALPYWDMTIDQRLEDAARSNIWTSEFVGNGFGKINKGYFNNWSHDRGYVKRYLGENYFLPSKIAIKNVAHFPYTELESIHNESHAFVGGDMQNPNVSPSDPVFWVLHSFYDMVWQEYIEKNTHGGRSLINTYPQSHVYPLNRTLGLVPLTISGALNVSYLLGKHMIRFESTSSCLADKGCNSNYLECNPESRNCRPKKRVCVDEEEPSLDTYCDVVNCTSNWTQFDITIYASYSNVKPRCHHLCSNAIHLNIFISGRRQQTIFLETAETYTNGIRLKVLIKQLTPISDFQVKDSCATPCSCYFLSEGKYEPCDMMSTNNLWRKKTLKSFEKQRTRSENQTLFIFKCGNQREGEAKGKLV